MDAPMIPSKNFPRDVRELWQYLWDPRVRFSRDLVRVEGQRILRPDVELPPDMTLSDPETGTQVDRRA